MQKTAKKVYRKAKTKVNNKNNTLKKVGIIVAVIIVAVAIIGLNVYNYAKDSGFVERRTVAVSTENYSLSQAQMTYYFYSQYQSFYSQFSSYGMDVSTYIDPSLPLTQQKCTFSNNQTWYEYFMSSAVSMAKEQLSLCEAAKKADIKLTDAAKSEIKAITGAVSEIMDLTLDAFTNTNLDAAANIEPLEEVIDTLKVQLRANHISRMQKGECSIEAGFVWADIITNLERVSDHCSNIAVNIIQLNKESFDTHEYLNEIKADDDGQYAHKFASYLEKYALPKSV